ncbi:AAA family ATPase, partial [Asanoa sp. NPDC050611]|uniref:ATP-binding protein n=1 Tax=Asanoa sp. NPDC050611 TaxID=3157098 RepID=UPI0033FC6EC1
MGQIGIRLVGPFAVVRDGRVLPDAEVGSRKARTLLALLAAERRVVAVDQLVGALWPARPPARPADNVATLVSRVRAALGADLVEGGRSGYRLPADVTVDLHEAARFVAEAERRLPADPAAALDAAGWAEGVLAAAPALTGEPAADWAAAVRADQAAHLRRARQVVAAAALAGGQPARARDAALAAGRADPFDEDAVRALMRAHDALGEPAKALEVYERLRALLAEELGVDPAAATRDLHVAVLRGRTTPADVPVFQPPPPPRLAGRDAEIDRLAGAWRDAGAGRPRLVLVTGEPGIGKTRLAVELARLADGVVVTVRCYAAERSLFLQPFVEAVAALVADAPPDRVRAAAGDRAGALATLVPAAAAVLGAPPAEHGSPEAERRAAYEAVTVFLRRLAVPRPVLLVVDDLQHAGTATVELLHYLARHAGGARLLVVATVRAAEGREALATLDEVADVVPLGPLDGAAIAHLARAAGQDARAAEIARRTRGHTLFVVETLRALAAGHTGVPSSLRASVLTRVRAAGPGAEELLRAAAVLGTSFAPAAVAGLLGVGTAEATLRCDRILETRLTVVAGRAYEFANDLVQEVLYDSTPQPTRLAHHLRAADVLADNPEAVARHAQAAGDDRRAGRAWLAAGRRAARRYAASDAEPLLGNAIAAAERCGDAEL